MGEKLLKLCYFISREDKVRLTDLEKWVCLKYKYDCDSATFYFLKSKVIYDLALKGKGFSDCWFVMAKENLNFLYKQMA